MTALGGYDGVICGRGTTKLGKLKRPLNDLVREAFHLALEDAKLPAEAVKGVVSMPAVADLGGLSLMPAHQMAMDLGLLTRPGGQEMICKTVDCGGASPVVALREACQLLREENLGCVAVIGADAVASMPTKEFLKRVSGSKQGNGGAVIPEKYGEFATWHVQTFGTKRDELASVAEFMSLQAAKHPNSFSKGGRCLSASEVMSSPRVAQNTNLFECAKRADGAAVVLVCSNEFVAQRGLLHMSVPILGIGEASGALMPEGEYIGSHAIPIHLAARRAMRKANVRSIDQLGWFGLYDCFPVAFISSLEQVGLCPHGAGGAWVKQAVKRVKEGKKVNVNTHGGLLGAGAPWEAPAMFTIVEAYDQLLGRCGKDRQIDGVTRALVQGNGGTFSHEAVAILGWPTEVSKGAPRFPPAASRGANFPTTSLSSLLGVRYPIMSAGMGGVARARLAAEVSEAGGLGCLGAASLSVKEIRAEVQEIKRMTSKPFAINLLASDDNMGEKAREIAGSGAKAFVTGLGVAKDAVDYMHKNGVLVGVVCGQVKHALSAVRAGCDFVIAQGTEGGGHTGNIALFALLPQIRAAVPPHIPVVAAGGVHDGKTFVAALSLGAAGVWMGTRFLLTFEANTVRGYKECLLPASSHDTTVTRYYTGKPCRVLKNKQTEKFSASGDTPAKFPEQFLKSKAEGNNHLLDGNHATTGVKLDSEFMPAGQVVGSIKQILPARLVIESIVEEAREVVEGLQGRALSSKL
ncbi:nitronate monooxygenase [Chloropicon primus]|uniref:Nitronate monooxygenase n=2 Tax=Chloropicon primus TaxID=1764295 RepID=A0A5B8MHV8_9CHLO|nr:nitronate monooxygenase [Chloropicon primus]UPQ99268.1 nitronate monooxygenase [Chloropicon primus]|eukprot:QDZ20056.1 nitronate monooxygenase [Chloropicon primus]